MKPTPSTAVRRINPYDLQIMEMTGCNEEDAGLIQDIMRNHLFHSTLDWQSAAQLQQAALEARKILEADRSPWKEWREGTRRIHENGQQNEGDASPAREQSSDEI